MDATPAELLQQDIAEAYLSGLALPEDGDPTVRVLLQQA
jgi:hypothetical protein